MDDFEKRMRAVRRMRWGLVIFMALVAIGLPVFLVYIMAHLDYAVLGQGIGEFIGNIKAGMDEVYEP